MRKLLLLSLIFSSLTLARAPGKAAKGGGRAAPAEPGYQISADRKVTFRLRAPQATTVTVSGDFATGAQNMTKGPDGNWTATFGPLRPAIYNYRFTVDGLATNEAIGRLSGREPLQARIGISSGLVVVGDLIGEGAAQERGVVGETPNLAARLQALAAPGTLVVADTTPGRSAASLSSMISGRNRWPASPRRSPPGA